MRGLLCLKLDSMDDPEKRYALFLCRNLIYATGGPAGMYADSVYPNGHFGASGLAFLAGVAGKNLTEWQYGLASVRPRWNVSGTYMQVLPRFVSTEQDGSDPKEFLNDFFGDRARDALHGIPKGLPVALRRAKDRRGSSIIDLWCILKPVGRGAGCSWTFVTTREGRPWSLRICCPR